MAPATPNQTETEVEIQEDSAPHQIEQASHFAPKKGTKIKTPVKKRHRVIRKVSSILLMPEPIPKEDEEEDDEDNVPLNKRTQLAKAIE